MGRGVPSPSDYIGSGGASKALPAGSRAKPPCLKWILCIFRIRKKPSGTPFLVFLSDVRSPNVAGPQKTFPIPPALDRPDAHYNHITNNDDDVQLQEEVAGYAEQSGAVNLWG